MENLPVYFIISVFSFIAGFLCRVYFDRHSDGSVEAELKAAQDSNAELKKRLEEFQRCLSEHESKLRAAADRAEEMAGIESRVEYASERISDGVSYLKGAHESAESSIRRSEELIDQISAILDNAEKKS